MAKQIIAESTLPPILLISQASEFILPWRHLLALDYAMQYQEAIPNTLDEFDQYKIILINVALLNSEKIDYSELKKMGVKCLLLGEQWPEAKQINALVEGASGYCEIKVSPTLISKSVASVIRGEIWLERHLIPQVIGSLIKTNPQATEVDHEYENKKKLLDTLSSRELDVAKLIRSGKSNKIIASTLFISERTVKAHLTSIFKKMQVSDRLHLAISLKGFDI